MVTFLSPTPSIEGCSDLGTRKSLNQHTLRHIGLSLATLAVPPGPPPPDCLVPLKVVHKSRS